MRQYCLFLFVLQFNTSCHDKFDKSGWEERVDIWYPNRERMLSDLLENYQLKGEEISNVVKLLGVPDNYEKNAAYYSITEEYEFLDIDPYRGKNLILLFTQDSTITDVKVKEWGNY